MENKEKGAWVFDIEATGLRHEATKIHCLVATNTKTKENVELVTYESMKEFLQTRVHTLIGHNIVTYDVPVLEDLLGIKIEATKVDTLAISYYLHSSNPSIVKFGLEAWGTYYGIPKPVIADDEWEGLPDEELEYIELHKGEEATNERYRELLKKKEEHTNLMIHRCSEDVKINLQLYFDQMSQLMEVYERDVEAIKKVIAYLTFKMECMRIQEEEGVKLDVEKCLEEIWRLEALIEPKIEALKAVMPRKVVKDKRKRPKNLFKTNGELSTHGMRWKKFCEEQGINYLDEAIQEFEYDKTTEEPKPGSHDQVKAWLFSLGWKPEHLKFVRNKVTNVVRQIPQIKHKTEEGDVCDSIKKLYAVEPELENLASLSMLNSRVNNLKGFIRDSRYGRLYQYTGGLTNTMRLQHRVIVNVPKVSAMFAENIRACFVASEGKILLSADLSGIEDATKMHYIYPFDKKYVEEVQTPTFDAHIAISVLAEMITQEEGDFYRWYNKKRPEDIKISEYFSSMSEEEMAIEFNRIGEIRQIGKTVNFACTYGAGVQTIMSQTGLTQAQASKTHKAYWEMNDGITQFSRSAKTKVINGQMWLLNPVSGFWLTLRSQKDIFSTCNQSTAVYVYDLWVEEVIKRGLRPTFQAHDEFNCELINSTEEIEKSLQLVKEAIVAVNEKLKLNVEVKYSAEVGGRYSDIH